MANLLPQPGALRPTAQLHKDFKAFYGDPTLDRCQGDYTRIIDRFDSELNPAISHVILLEQALGMQAVPQAYLCCTHC
jgi:hypothetical protein